MAIIIIMIMIIIIDSVATEFYMNIDDVWSRQEASSSRVWQRSDVIVERIHEKHQQGESDLSASVGRHLEIKLVWWFQYHSDMEQSTLQSPSGSC